MPRAPGILPTVFLVVGPILPAPGGFSVPVPQTAPCRGAKVGTLVLGLRLGTAVPSGGWARLSRLGVVDSSGHVGLAVLGLAAVLGGCRVCTSWLCPGVEAGYLCCSRTGGRSLVLLLVRPRPSCHRCARGRRCSCWPLCHPSGSLVPHPTLAGLPSRVGEQVLLSERSPGEHSPASFLSCVVIDRVAVCRLKPLEEPVLPAHELGDLWDRLQVPAVSTLKCQGLGVGQLLRKPEVACCPRSRSAPSWPEASSSSCSSASLWSLLARPLANRLAMASSDLLLLLPLSQPLPLLGFPFPLAFPVLRVVPGPPHGPRRSRNQHGGDLR